jgi:uncharacterized protein
MNLTPSHTNSWWQRLWRQLVPPMADFYGMLENQADNLSLTLNALDDFLQSGNPKLADHVNDMVEKGHNMRDHNLRQLYRSFITPIDREDIYTLTMSFDHILDYIKNTVREVEVLQIDADEWMRKMAMELAAGAVTLSRGVEQFRAGQAQNVTLQVQTREAERRIEDLYREALEDMFQGEEYQQLISSSEPTDVRGCLNFVINRIKRREVYRHLSNAADRLAHAGEALRDMSIKYDTGGTGSRRDK